MRVGIIGYSNQKFDEAKARQLLREVILGVNPGAVMFGISPVGVSTVVSGRTNMGIPAIAYEIAQAAGLRTIGVACSKASEFDCFPCDEVVTVGTEWGDESLAFLACCDRVVRIGGGAQSLAECEKARALGKEVIEFDLPAIP